LLVGAIGSAHSCKITVRDLQNAVLSDFHDVIHELSKRLDALWRYDQYTANAKDDSPLPGFWKEMKQQEQENVKRLKQFGLFLTLCRCLCKRRPWFSGGVFLLGEWSNGLPTIAGLRPRRADLGIARTTCCLSRKRGCFVFNRLTGRINGLLDLTGDNQSAH
jgi:hypothetical protein